MKSEYLIFDFIVGVMPLLGLAMYRRGIWPKWSAAIKAILPVGSLYLIWDQLVTNSWWKFNPRFTLGLHIGNLPIEEILFFLVVPYSCLVLWVNLNQLDKRNWSFPIEQVLGLVFTGWGVVALYNQKWYSLTVCLVSLVLLFCSWKAGFWLRKKSVSIFGVIVIALTIIFNGYLTARPIVQYASSPISNIRIGSVPVEDIVYGMNLILAISLLYEFLNHQLPTKSVLTTS